MHRGSTSVSGARALEGAVSGRKSRTTRGDRPSPLRHQSGLCSPTLRPVQAQVTRWRHRQRRSGDDPGTDSSGQRSARRRRDEADGEAPQPASIMGSPAGSSMGTHRNSRQNPAPPRPKACGAASSDSGADGETPGGGPSTHSAGPEPDGFDDEQ
jgi:hypothetical protein